MKIELYKSSLPETKEGKTFLQIPQNTNPTNIYTCSISTTSSMNLFISVTQLAITWASKKQLRMIIVTDVYKAIIMKIKTYKKNKFEEETE